MVLQFPRHQPASAPAAFIENNVELCRHDSNFEYVPPLDMFMTESDARQQEQIIKTLWINTHRHREELFDVMDKFQMRIVKKDPSIMHIDVRVCSWQEVMEELSKAEAYHQSKVFSRFRPVLKYIRGFKKYASTINNWVDLLPAGDYGSSLCGAFKLVLGAAGRLHDIESFISTALSEIPEAINKAGRVCRIYRHEQPFALTQKMVQLYDAVVVAFKRLMEYFIDHTAKRIASAMVFGSNYKASLEESINNVKRCAVQIDDEAMVCLHDRSNKIHNSNNRIAATLTHIQQSLIPENARGSEELKSTAGVILEVTPNIPMIEASEQTTKHPHVKDERDQFMDFLNRYKDMLSATPILERRTGRPRDDAKKDGTRKVSKKQRPSIGNKALTKSSSTETQGIGLEELIDLLTYNPDDLTQDVGDCCDLGETMSEEEKSSASQAVRSTQLRKFLVDANKSRVLLIHGNAEDPAPSSFLSLLVGRLCRTFVDTKDVIVLSYFCGLHAEIWDPKANASGMMSNIIGQLLSNPRVTYDLSFVDDRMYELLEKDDCRILCELFLHLIDQLPQNEIVFCFIDSISIYETEERARDTCLVLSTLTHFITQQDGGAILKLLVTEPGRSQYAWHYITDENDVLEMNDSNEDDGLGLEEIEDGFELSDEDSV